MDNAGDTAFSDVHVVVTGAGRGTGRRLAEAFDARGAYVHAAARSLTAAEETVAGLRRGSAYVCDLASPDSVRSFAAALAERTDRVDVLVNNGAGYLHGELGDGTDEEIEAVIASAVTGTVLLTRHLLPALRRSARPDVVDIVSGCGEYGHRRSEAHPAFYAAKSGQAGFGEILSHRLRPEGVRVISLYPPDFVQEGPRTAGADLTAASVVDCVLFAVGQPRDCFIRAFHFEQRR